MEEQKKFTAKCEYDLAAFRGYVRDGMLKSKKFSVFFILGVAVCYILALAAINIVSIANEPQGRIAHAFAAAFCLAVAAALAYFVFFMPRLLVRKQKKLGHVTTEFSFGADSFESFTVSDKINAHAEIKYSMLERIIEKGNYFYIFTDKNSTLIVDRSTVAGGTPEELSALLRAAVGKKRFRGKNK